MSPLGNFNPSKLNTAHALPKCLPTCFCPTLGIFLNEPLQNVVFGGISSLKLKVLLVYIPPMLQESQRYMYESLMCRVAQSNILVTSAALIRHAFRISRSYFARKHIIQKRTGHRKRAGVQDSAQRVKYMYMCVH